MNPRNCLLISGVCAALIPIIAQKAPDPKIPAARGEHAKSVGDDMTRGQRVFQQNCARCHDAPQGFPPQISGTILRHMRVRANLSAADERALLRFLNP
jgi:cytochrome c2